MSVIQALEGEAKFTLLTPEKHLPMNKYGRAERISVEKAENKRRLESKSVDSLFLTKIQQFELLSYSCHRSVHMRGCVC